MVACAGRRNNPYLSICVLHNTFPKISRTQSKVAEPNTHAMHSFVIMQKAQYLPIINSNAMRRVHTGPHVIQSGNKRIYMINKFIRGKRKTIERTKTKRSGYLILYPLII